MTARVGFILLYGLVASTAFGEAKKAVPEPVKLFLRDSAAELAGVPAAVERDEYVRVHNRRVAVAGCCDVPGQTLFVVTMELGTLDGNAGIPLFRSYLIDATGAVVARYRGMEGSTRPVSFLVDGKRTIVAFTAGGEHGAPQSVSFWTVEREPAKVYEMRPESGGGHVVDATLTFASADGDRAPRDILVEKTVRDFGRKRKWREYELIRYDREAKTWVYPTRVDAKRYAKLLKQREAEKDRPSVVVYGSPYETSLENELVWSDRPD